MKQILLFIAISFTVGATAQNVISYYQGINAGKMLASQSKFNSAVYAYHEVFKTNDFVFARDCFNAIELAILAQDTAKLGYFIERAILQGIRISDLEKSSRISNYLQLHVIDTIRAKEDSLRAIYYSKINAEIRTEINQMFSEDQELREKYYSANALQKRKIAKAWEALNTAQTERLLAITHQYGFPGEKLIGIDRNEMHPKIKTANYTSGMPIVIFIHHYSQPNLSHDSLLFAEVIKGNLYNEHFATICDFEAKFGRNKHSQFGYYGLRFKAKNMDKNTLNARREQIGILTLEQLEMTNQIKNITKFWNRLY